MSKTQFYLRKCLLYCLAGAVGSLSQATASTAAHADDTNQQKSGHSNKNKKKKKKGGDKEESGDNGRTVAVMPERPDVNSGRKATGIKDNGDKSSKQNAK